MSGDVHVQFCERPGVRFPRATHLVVGCQRKEDAKQFLRDLKERLGQFALDLHPDKTRLIEFGRFAMVDRRARGERRPETFDFLGFTHYAGRRGTAALVWGANRLRSGSREPRNGSRSDFARGCTKTSTRRRNGWGRWSTAG